MLGTAVRALAAVAAVGGCLVAAAAAQPQTGRIVEVQIKSVRVWRDPKKDAAGGEILALARAGGPLDWAATAIALADAAVSAGALDFVSVDLQDADVAALAVPADYKRLAVAYLAPNPPKSPWEDDPFAVYPAARRAPPVAAARIAEYESLRSEILARTRNAEQARSEAALTLAQRLGLPHWAPPPDNLAGAPRLRRREELRIEGRFAPPTLLTLQLCLRTPVDDNNWGCTR